MSENKMDGDHKALLLGLLMGFVLAAGLLTGALYHDAYINALVADMVISGVDPIHAKCALSAC